MDSLGLEANAMTFRFGPQGSTYDVLLSRTIFLSPYYNETPEAQDATRIHEDIHRYDPGQQTLAITDRRQQEIDAYTAEINYTKGQIARLKLQLNALNAPGQCGDKETIMQVQNSIRNYYDSLRDAEASLEFYQNSNWLTALF
jgi:hypothetical protein